MESFSQLNLSETILEAMRSLQFQKPTLIQEKAIPVALAGRDLLASSQTGTGKTTAYGIPLVHYLHTNSDKAALVLTPTRELSLQVLKSLKNIMGKKKLKTALLIGGEPFNKQFADLKAKPQIIVGTLGRVNDHLTRKTLSLKNVTFLVLDECDRIMDMGFTVQLDSIVKYLPKERQTLMFSATLSEPINKLAQKYLYNPVTLSLGPALPAQTIQQQMIKTFEQEKYNIVLQKLAESNGTFLIFTKTKIKTQKIADRLQADNHAARAIHGDLKQRVRDKVLEGFRRKEKRILVATDVASRGLDVPNIECVINYDLPECPADYIHRIGRTGRAGASGTAINLVSPDDTKKWNQICTILNGKEGHEQQLHKKPSKHSNKSFRKRKATTNRKRNN